MLTMEDEIARLQVGFHFCLFDGSLQAAAFLLTVEISALKTNIKKERRQQVNTLISLSTVSR